MSDLPCEFDHPHPEHPCGRRIAISPACGNNDHDRCHGLAAPHHCACPCHNDPPDFAGELNRLRGERSGWSVS